MPVEGYQSECLKERIDLRKTRLAHSGTYIDETRHLDDARVGAAQVILPTVDEVHENLVRSHICCGSRLRGTELLHGQSIGISVCDRLDGQVPISCPEVLSRYERRVLNPLGEAPSDHLT